MSKKINDLSNFTEVYLVNYAYGEHKQSLALCYSESEAEAVVEYYEEHHKNRDVKLQFYYYNKLRISKKLAPCIVSDYLDERLEHGKYLILNQEDDNDSGRNV